MKQPQPSSDILIGLPTYNERPNVSGLVGRIRSLLPAADILFIDDGSPDGTGAELERIAGRETGVHVIHRPSRLGVGSAHQAAIRFAYRHGYRLLITMDADGTHDPEDINRLVEQADASAVVVGSRFLPAASDRRRRLDTFQSRLVHRLTTRLLNMPADMSNAFRLYRLDKINPEIFAACRSAGYAFFPESLYCLHRAGFTVSEVPVRLAPRQAGKSKKRARDVGEWLFRLACLRGRI